MTPSRPAACTAPEFIMICFACLLASLLQLPSDTHLHPDDGDEGIVLTNTEGP